MSNIEIIKQCRLCESKKLKKIFDFGKTPLANSYPKSQEEIENYYPLSVAKCDDCGHVQLFETVNPELLFKNYLYASSDSLVLKKHFNQYAKDVLDVCDKSNELTSILEIGCNDGILLKEFANLYLINLYGVEPATNIVKIAKKQTSAKIFNTFFNLDSATKIGEEIGKVNIICANNVFAHVDKLDSLINGIKHLLTPDGVFVFENAYLLDTIKGLYFDQIYHEHLQYYGIKPLISLFNLYDMEIFRIKHIDTQGGSFRIYVQNKKSGEYLIDDSVSKFVKAEEKFNLYEDLTYKQFNQKIKDLCIKMEELINKIQYQNKTISCYGCPAKFALFSKIFGLNNLNIKYVIDDSPLKQNLFSPGQKIPIVNKEFFYKNPTDYCIISAWNMADSIIERNKQYTGKFIVPLPKIHIK